MKNRQDRRFGIGLGIGVALGFLLGSILADRLGNEAAEAARSVVNRLQRRTSGVRFEALLQ
ncbi:MAG: hypothetical protein ACOX87_05340 [Chloroflexota bacterium]